MSSSFCRGPWRSNAAQCSQLQVSGPETTSEKRGHATHFNTNWHTLFVFPVKLFYAEKYADFTILLEGEMLHKVLHMKTKTNKKPSLLDEHECLHSI